MGNDYMFEDENEQYRQQAYYYQLSSFYRLLHSSPSFISLRSLELFLESLLDPLLEFFVESLFNVFSNNSLKFVPPPTLSEMTS